VAELKVNISNMDKSKIKLIIFVLALIAYILFLKFNTLPDDYFAGPLLILADSPAPAGIILFGTAVILFPLVWFIALLFFLKSKNNVKSESKIK
jgi:hypothetical protein